MRYGENMNKTKKVKDRFFKSIDSLRYYAIKANNENGGLSEQLTEAEAKNEIMEDNEPHVSHAGNKNSSNNNKNTRTGTRTGTIG